MSLAMTKKEREAFLADLHVGVISIEQAGGPPLTVPIWYDYKPGAGVWAITADRINFHGFARLMRDALGTPDALYIDGKVSRLWAPELGRADIGFSMGPIMAVVAPR